MRPTPRATYRIQLTPSFDLGRAAAVVPYLARLGISHLYTSPLAEATPGSTHGYDVTDHHRVRAELGGEAGLRRLWEALDAHGMGLVVDIVPNHMGIRSPRNRWWQDLLRRGRESPYAAHFDVEWEPPDPASHGKVVLPFLDRPVDDAVRAGAIDVGVVDGEPVALHHDDRWPLSTRSLAEAGLDPGAPDPGALERLRRDPAALARLLDAQHWRAVHWRSAGDLLNWRRFFDVTDLAAVQVERPDVFDDVHALLRSWLDDDLGARVVQGVRVDHVDGLVDPQGYLQRLRALVGPDRLVLVEKILAAHERLPAGWPVDGTTGYEVVARLDEALTDPAGAAALRRRAEAFVGDDEPWEQVELGCRRLVARRLLHPEVDRAARALQDAVAHRGGEPLDTRVAVDVVRELAAEQAVYRTYPRPDHAEVSDQDREELDRAVQRLARHRPDLPADLVATARALLTGDEQRGAPGEAFARRFGQLTAPLAAKAVEDTGFYRAVSLPWLNEVGGAPDRAEVPLAEVQAALGHLATAWPGTLTPLTTHDTKRGGDVRARLSRLAAAPDAFADAVDGWHGAAAPHRSPDGPDRATEWLLWCTLVGAWPVDLDRMAAYATKAMREAKARTSWLDPDEAFESAVQRFLAGVLDDGELVASIDRFVATVRAPGRAAALAQVAVAATAVGAPDLYQGEELWNLVLVDPDNRRPVDHERRSQLLHELEAGTVDVAEQWRLDADDPDDDGLVKLALWHRLLALRAERPDAFAGPCVALAVTGPGADAHLAYRRGGDVAVVVPVREVDGSGRGTVELPEGRWRDAVTGGVVDGGPAPVAELVARFPVAVLARI